MWRANSFKGCQHIATKRAAGGAQGPWIGEVHRTLHTHAMPTPLHTELCLPIAADGTFSGQHRRWLGFDRARRLKKLCVQQCAVLLKPLCIFVTQLL